MNNLNLMFIVVSTCLFMYGLYYTLFLRNAIRYKVIRNKITFMIYPVLIGICIWNGWKEAWSMNSLTVIILIISLSFILLVKESGIAVNGIHNGGILIKWKEVEKVVLTTDNLQTRVEYVYRGRVNSFYLEYTEQEVSSFINKYNIKKA